MSKPRRKLSPPEPAEAEKPAPQAKNDGPSQARRSERQVKNNGAGRQIDWAICVALILTVFAVYASVSHFDFVTYDDPKYVYENAHVRAGLTFDNIGWALTSVVDANWLPVTMISHMAGCELFGVASGMHHMINVFLHAMAAVLLFITLRRATRARWPSAFVAMVFALHPLHVESVAWVSERKDVLSTFFWFLALYAYVRYSERASPRRYLLVVAAFCLGLMSKPMLVTFPFTLLLVDVWPLRRMEFPRTLWEKAPLLALSAASSVAAFFAQRSAGAVQTLPFGERVGNALVSYIVYIGQMVWPSGLAVFYPYPQSIPAWQVAGAAAIIAGVSALAIWAWRTRPYVATGWFWFLGTLVPVIGLVQVGFQSHADRYMYVPMIGLSMMAAWGAMDMIEKWPRAKSAMVSAGVVISLACLVASSAQAEYWRNTETLYRRALSVTENNYVAEFGLGDYLLDVPGHGPEAVSHFEAALRIKPDLPDAHNSIGVYLLQNGRNAEAIAQFEAALGIKPDFADAHFNLGLALEKNPDRAADAIARYEAALRLKPDLAVAHKSLGMLLLRVGRTAEGISQLQLAQRIHADPDITRILAGMGGVPR